MFNARRLNEYPCFISFNKSNLNEYWLLEFIGHKDSSVWIYHGILNYFIRSQGNLEEYVGNYICSSVYKSLKTDLYFGSLWH